MAHGSGAADATAEAYAASAGPASDEHGSRPCEAHGCRAGAAVQTYTAEAER